MAKHSPAGVSSAFDFIDAIIEPDYVSIHKGFNACVNRDFFRHLAELTEAHVRSQIGSDELCDNPKNAHMFQTIKTQIAASFKDLTNNTANLILAAACEREADTPEIKEDFVQRKRTRREATKDEYEGWKARNE